MSEKDNKILMEALREISKLAAGARDVCRIVDHLKEVDKIFDYIVDTAQDAIAEVCDED